MGSYFQSPGIWMGWVLKCRAAHQYQNDPQVTPAPEAHHRLLLDKHKK